MEDFFAAEIKSLFFPLNEYIQKFGKHPESFDFAGVFAHVVGCYCFCVAASNLVNSSKITPNEKNPYGLFRYKFCDFEKKYLASISQVRKNKILAVKKINILQGNSYVEILSCGKNSLKIAINIDFEVLAIENTSDINTLFNLIWSELALQLNKSQKEYSQKTISYVPEYLKFATAPFVHELRRLLTSEKGDLNNSNGLLLKDKITSSGHYIFENISENAEISEKMSDLTVDVLNALVHLMIEYSKTPDMKVLFNIDDLLFIRGKKASKNKIGKRGGYKESQRIEILEQLKILANIKINVLNSYLPMLNANKTKIYSKYSGESPVLFVKKADGENMFYASAGEVLALSLQGAAMKTGLLHKKIAEYDYYRNFWEKRIGNYLAWLWRSRQNKADFLVPVTVETLLKQVNSEIITKNAQTTRNRLENALDKLENDSVIKAWQYIDIDEEALIGRNWVKNWLKLKLIIEPPIEILEEYSKIKKIRKNKAKKYDYKDFLDAVKQKNISQILLAEEIKIENTKIAGIITGKYIPDAGEKRKIRNWLEKNTEK